MNNIQYLINYISNEIIEKKQIQVNLLNNIIYIEKIKEQLSIGAIQDIDVKTLESIMKKIGIEEDEIFLQIKHVLEEFFIDADQFNDNISQEKEVELLLTAFQQLQEYADYQEDLEEKIVESYMNILIKITESLYDKEVQNIRNSPEYKNLDKEIKELESLLLCLKQQEPLTQEQKDKIYYYIENSKIEDKISIYIELASKWIEQAKEVKLISEESFIESLIIEPVNNLAQVEQEEVAIIQENQRKKLAELTGKMTQAEWEKEIKKTINLIKENNILTQEQKNVLEKILLMCLNEELEDLNMSKEILAEYPEINIDTRNQEYLTSSRFETNSIGADLVMHLIPNIKNRELSDIMTIINKIIEKFKESFLSREELDEIKQLIQNTRENYGTITFVNYNDEKVLDLESMFIEFKGEKEKIIDYDKYADKLLITDEQYNKFTENTFKKIIKTKLEELGNLLEKNEINGLVKRNGINILREEIELWTSKFEEYITIKELKTPYKIYTIEELEGLNFGDKNAIIFLRGDSGKTLYEEGLLKNGQKQNNQMEIKSLRDLPKIIKNIYFNDKNLRTKYRKFKNDVQDNETSHSSKKPSDRDNPVIIADKVLERLSEPASKARISIIKIDTIPLENKEKLGISSNNCVVLVLGSYEVNFNKEPDTYGEMAKEARFYKMQIQKIISALEDPNTPKKVLLYYIADSYGLLEYLTHESGQHEMMPEQPGIGGRS